ncbi:hypothetical protein ACWF0M_10260 [Kribbella sp. NPDC055110]
MTDYDPPYAIARTTTEAMLYLDLTVCHGCGSDQAAWQYDVHDGALRYVGACADCGAEREYLFSPPYDGLLDDVATFGGPAPSELVDAGQWLAVADWIAGEVAADDRSEAARTAMAHACQAVQEVLKFVSPYGDVVPEEAFWTDAGRAERDRDPGRFRLDRLLAVRDSYSG